MQEREATRRPMCGTPPSLVACPDCLKRQLTTGSDEEARKVLRRMGEYLRQQLESLYREMVKAGVKVS
jgi:hypothetical protein